MGRSRTPQDGTGSLSQTGGREKARTGNPLRHARLTRHSEFLYVRKHGKSRAGRYCVVEAVSAPDRQCRIAIVISRRYSPKAVTRNRARRLLRNSCNDLYPKLKKCWIVVRPRQFAKGAKCQDVRREVDMLCSKLKILRREETDESA